MKKTTTPKEWIHHLAAQQDGGKTVKLYCHDNSLDLSSFYRQKRKRGTHDVDRSPQAFVRAPTLRQRRVSCSSLAIRVKDLTLTLEPGYCSEDLEGVLVTLSRVQHVLGRE